jgi:ABC-2 type transport system ATP-binding protein
MENAIEMVNLKKSFPDKGRGGTLAAVNGVTLTVPRGEIFGFLGPNGAGKTTCQRMLTTLLPIDQGEAWIAGFNVAKQAPEVRRRIGYVSQAGGADGSATGRENLMLAGRLYGLGKEAAKKKTEELSRLLDLHELLDRIAGTYSGGQKRRLEIALGIMHEPEILFLDEPSAGLDPQNRVNLWNHIRSLQKNGMTVFLTTHYLEEADELAGYLAIMDHGTIIARGTPKELKRQIAGEVITIKPKHNASLIALQDMALGELSINQYVNRTIAEKESLILYVTESIKITPLLFDLLKRRGIELESISISPPSLDDVFLKQTGYSLRDSGKEETT